MASTARDAGILPVIRGAGGIIEQTIEEFGRVPRNIGLVPKVIATPDLEADIDKPVFHQDLPRFRAIEDERSAEIDSIRRRGRVGVTSLRARDGAVSTGLFIPR